MLNPNWLNEAIANTKQRTSSLAVNGPAAYGPYLQESRLDIRRNSHNPPPQQLLDTNNFPDLQQQQQRPSSAHSFPSLFPQQEQNDFHQQMVSQGQQGSQMQPLSSRVYFFLKFFVGRLGWGNPQKFCGFIFSDFFPNDYLVYAVLSQAKNFLKLIFYTLSVLIEAHALLEAHTL
ncbi:unnamed protein product [Meloidogyne enterolobii]|uniref:Uncharacterized protein n=1 Tax=Meloidogyne enterolobii TaxID=390850 RepID=A0ACB1AYY1_MELEN